jgi:hypothetical protein
MYATDQSTSFNFPVAYDMYEYKRTLEMAEVGLLVELGRLETEGVHDVVDLDGTILETLIGFLSRGVGSSV